MNAILNGKVTYPKPSYKQQLIFKQNVSFPYKCEMSILVTTRQIQQYKIILAKSKNWIINWLKLKVIFCFWLGSNSGNIIYILARAARPRIGSARESFLSNSSHEVLEKARKALETQRLQSDSTSTLSEGEDEDDIDDIENQIEENEELQALESKVAKRKEQIVDIRYLFICLLPDFYLFISVSK